MKGIIVLVSFLMALAISTAAQKHLQTVVITPLDWISVEVEGGKTLQLKAADFAKLPRRELKAKDHDGKENTYSGVELKEILKLAGAKLGADLRGKEMANYLFIEAADNYHAVYALSELDDTFTDKIVILADTIDGKPLDVKNGPWQIVASDEKKHARWVRQVTALKVKKAT